MHNLRPHALALLLGAIFSLSHAARPLATETADALAARQCEVEADTTLASDKQTSSAREANLLMSCGVFGTTQAAVGLSRSRQHSQSAYGTSLIGKTSFGMPEEGKPAFAMRYGVNWSQLPGENGELTDLHLLFLASHEISNGMAVHANLGLRRNRAEKSNTTLWSLGIEKNTDLLLAADVYGEGREKPWVSAGIGYVLGHGLSISATLARQLQEPRGRRFGLGLKMDF